MLILTQKWELNAEKKNRSFEKAPISYRNSTSTFLSFFSFFSLFSFWAYFEIIALSVLNNNSFYTCTIWMKENGNDVNLRSIKRRKMEMMSTFGQLREKKRKYVIYQSGNNFSQCTWWWNFFYKAQTPTKITSLSAFQMKKVNQ